MGILREKTVWKKPRAPRPTARPDELTPEEQANVRAALRFLRLRMGSWIALAKAMGLKPNTLQEAAGRKTRRPTAGIALRTARVAQVRVEIILAGKWPTPLTPVNASPFRGYVRAR